jgi:3(or 17)beta-hydroxysteroid dehydrogenase
MSGSQGAVDGLVAIVTGAASGLGAADAQVLAAAGATVFMTDLNADAGRQAADAIGSSARFVEQDVRSEVAWVELVAEVGRSAGRLDILVNNAGLVRFADVEHCSLEDFRLLNAVMAEGVFLGCKHAIPLMARGGGGSIINMSSMGALQGFARVFAYSAAKGAVRSMTKAIAAYCLQRNYGIRCNAVYPGMIATGMVGEDATPEQVERREHSLDPLPHLAFGAAKDVAAMVLYLASPVSRYVTGADFVIDNGSTIIPAASGTSARDPSA